MVGVGVEGLGVPDPGRTGDSGLRDGWSNNSQRLDCTHSEWTSGTARQGTAGPPVPAPGTASWSRSGFWLVGGAWDTSEDHRCSENCRGYLQRHMRTVQELDLLVPARPCWRTDIPEELLPGPEDSFMGGGHCLSPFPNTDVWTSGEIPSLCRGHKYCVMSSHDVITADCFSFRLNGLPRLWGRGGRVPHCQSCGTS